MTDIFGSLYANTYDTLYREKDYAGECLVIERIFRAHEESRTKRLLDLGCGTGNHAARFAEMGYSVTGVERSGPMIEGAREKSAADPGFDLVQADIREFDLEREFDAAMLLFAVLGYQIEDHDVLATLRSARRHIRPRGLIVLDVWFGPAVLHERPVSRFARIPVESGELLRAAVPELDLARQVCRVRYDLWRVKDGQILEVASEEHAMRFFFPNELRLLLADSGFSLLQLAAFPDIDNEPGETTWNVIAVGRAEA
jgi:SAM-dependent methyltransferase